MQARFTEQEETAERRYRPETVQKAAALAARLQQERRETLSEAEVEQLAVEIGIEPHLMRQALATVTQSEAAAQTPAQATYPPPAYVSTQAQTAAQTRQRRAAGAIIGLSIPIFFAMMIVGLWFLRAAPAPPATLAPLQPVMEVEVLPTPPAPVQVVPRSGLLRNGGFEPLSGESGGGTFRAGSTAIPGWTVASGEVTQVPSTAEGRYALRLGRNGVVTQLFPTLPGRKYLISVSISGVQSAVPRMHYVDLSAQASTRILAAYTDMRGGKPVEWRRETMEFKAHEAGTQIAIGVDRSKVDPGTPIIDDVTVTPLPDP